MKSTVPPAGDPLGIPPGAEGRVSEWRDIASAPMGTSVLIAFLHPNNGWCMNVARFFADHWWSNGQTSWTPTHWMPIPSPPHSAPPVVDIRSMSQAEAEARGFA